MPVLLKDTLTTQPVNENATPNPGSNFTTIDGETRNTAGMTPYRVLQELRPDATDDQKDSAIQAHFKVGDIAYNTRTDTMTTFGIPGAEGEALREDTLHGHDLLPWREVFPP